MDINKFSNQSFGSATNVYFYTTNGKRILADENIRKCQRYLVNNLNYGNNKGKRNIDLVNTLAFDKKAAVQDVDYSFMHVARSFYKFVRSKSAGFVTLITGKDVANVEREAKNIGKAKHLAKTLTGRTASFETNYSTDRYIRAAENISKKSGIFKNGKRQAFGVLFDPVYNKHGKLNKFEYVRSGYFDEAKINNK